MAVAVHSAAEVTAASPERFCNTWKNPPKPECFGGFFTDQRHKKIDKVLCIMTICYLEYCGVIVGVLL